MIFNEKPENFVSDLEIVGCFINYDNKMLLLHRNSDKSEGNKWGVPGGKVDKEDSSIIRALVREIKEETGLSLNEKDLSFHKTFFVSHPWFNFYYHCFSLELKEISDITISKREHKNFKWVMPREALNLPLVLDEDHCIKDYYGIK